MLVAALTEIIKGPPRGPFALVPSSSRPRTPPRWLRNAAEARPWSCPPPGAARFPERGRAPFRASGDALHAAARPAWQAFRAKVARTLERKHDLVLNWFGAVVLAGLGELCQTLTQAPRMGGSLRRRPPGARACCGRQRRGRSEGRCPAVRRG